MFRVAKGGLTFVFRLDPKLAKQVGENLVEQANRAIAFPVAYPGANTAQPKGVQ